MHTSHDSSFGWNVGFFLNGFYLIQLFRLFELYRMTFRDKFCNAWIWSDILECPSETRAVPEIVKGECPLSLHSSYTCSFAVLFHRYWHFFTLRRGMLKDGIWLCSLWECSWVLVTSVGLGSCKWVRSPKWCLVFRELMVSSPGHTLSGKQLIP